MGINGTINNENEIRGTIAQGGSLAGQVSGSGGVSGSVAGAGRVSAELGSGSALRGALAIPRSGGGGTSDYEDLENLPQINGVTLIGDKTAEELGLMPLTDLGSFDIEEYDWEFWNYLADKAETGFYKVYEEQDGFTYFFRVERAGDSCYQEIWSTEETGLARQVRAGWYDGEEWSWDDPEHVMFSENIAAAYYNKNQVDTKLAGKVNTGTLANYYNKSQVDAMFAGYVPSNMIEIEWADLVELRDDGDLVPGAYYRITDYNFVTTKVNIQSGGHAFDIVVLAVSESMLSENAYACRHAGDHYFEREITVGGIPWLYTLFVDSYADSYGDEPIDHADDLHPNDVFCDYDYLEDPDSGDVVPVLYKTDSAEYSIDEPDYDDAFFWQGVYDLDGDEYDMWAKYEFDGNDWIFKEQYALTPIVVEDGELTVSPIPETKVVPVNMNAWQLKYCLDNDQSLYDWAVPEGKGVIYWMKDEFDNQAGYDFKNIKFRRRKITAVGDNVLSGFVNKYLGQEDYYKITVGSDSRFFYTFTDGDDNTADGSLFGSCAYNEIKPFIMDGKKTLNDIVIIGGSNNFADINCSLITLANGSNCRFGNSGLALLIFGGGSCSFGSNNRQDTIYSCGNVKTGNNFSYNHGANVSDSSFGVMNQYNNLGNSSSGIVMGLSCMNNKLGQWCYNDRFGDSVQNVTLGNYCSYSEFKGWNSNITMGNYYRYVTIEENVTRVTFSTSGGGATSYVQYVKVGKGVNNVTLTPARTRSYEQNYYKTGRTETAV